MKAEWKTIDSAPMDGTYVVTVCRGYLPCVTHYGTYFGKSRWGNDPEEFTQDSHFKEYWLETFYAPTHWDHLPEGPEE